MLIPDTFKKYCSALNDNMDNAVKYATAMSNKYGRIFKLQEQILRQRFTTNTQDDYTPIPWTSAPLNVQPFAEMARLIIHQNLMPNFFKKETLDAIRQTNPEHYDSLGDRAPIAYLHSLLVWCTFDEDTYLKQKQQIDWRKQEEARIHAIAEQYKRHQLAVANGKRAMAEIAKDPKLSERFLAGCNLINKLSKEQDNAFIKGQMDKIKNSPLLRTSFITNITR